MRNLFLFSSLFPLLVVSNFTFADWYLNPRLSQLSFVATKDAHVADNHYFTDIKGFVDKHGNAELIVNTHSVETSITQRNKYLRELLFQTDRFPQAKVELSLRRSHIQPESVGTSKQIDVTAFVNLVGRTLQQKAKLDVVYLSNERVQVTTMEPILLDAEDYGLLPAINTLRDIAGLKSLTVKVPISFKLVFEPANVVAKN